MLVHMQPTWVISHGWSCLTHQRSCQGANGIRSGSDARFRANWWYGLKAIWPRSCFCGRCPGHALPHTPARGAPFVARSECPAALPARRRDSRCRWPGAGYAVSSFIDLGCSRSFKIEFREAGLSDVAVRFFRPGHRGPPGLHQCIPLTVARGVADGFDL